MRSSIEVDLRFCANSRTIALQMRRVRKTSDRYKMGVIARSHSSASSACSFLEQSLRSVYRIGFKMGEQT